MKKHICIVFLLLLSGHLWAQTGKEDAMKKITDSVKMSYLRIAAIRYPILRQAGISTELVASSRLRSRFNDQDFYKGKGQIMRTRAFVNMPVYQSGKNTFSATVNYLHQQIEVKDVKSFNPQFPVSNQKLDRNTLGFMASYTRNDSAFGKPLVLSASVAYITDESFTRTRLNYLGLISMQVKQTATTALGLGLVVVIDPSSPVPVVPSVNYWHKFNAYDLELFVNLPVGASVRKELTSRAALSFGTEMTGYLSFFEMNKGIMPQNTVYTSLELRTGPKLECRFGKLTMLGISAGMINTLASNLQEENETNKNAFIKNKMGAVPYVNFSISLLPFFKGLR